MTMLTVKSFQYTIIEMNKRRLSSLHIKRMKKEKNQKGGFFFFVFHKPIVFVCLISHQHHDNDSQRFECNITRLISLVLISFCQCQMKLNSNSHNNILFIFDDNLCRVINQGSIFLIFFFFKYQKKIFLSFYHVVMCCCCVFVLYIKIFPR